MSTLIPTLTTTMPTVPAIPVVPASPAISAQVTSLPITTSFPSMIPNIQPQSPSTVVTTTIPIDCKRESEDYWDCFEPSFVEGKGTLCRPDCLRECGIWLGHARGILAECQEAMNEVLRIYPGDVSFTGTNSQTTEPRPELLEMEGVVPLTTRPRYLYAPQSFPSSSKSAFFEVRIPYLEMAIETPGYYILPNGQQRLRYYISHYITPIRLNDETKWKISSSLGEDGRPLTGISSNLVTNENILYDLNGAAQVICNIMGTSTLKSLVLTLEIPQSTLYTNFNSPEEMRRWWALFQGKIRVFKGRTAWFPPAAAGGYGDFADQYFFFTSQHDDPRPFRWRLRLSLRHLLLFYLIRTKPEGSDLTRLEKRSVTYSVLPKRVRSFFRDWFYSHG